MGGTEDPKKVPNVMGDKRRTHRTGVFSKNRTKARRVFGGLVSSLRQKLNNSSPDGTTCRLHTKQNQIPQTRTLGGGLRKSIHPKRSKWSEGYHQKQEKVTVSGAIQKERTAPSNCHAKPMSRHYFPRRQRGE